MLLSVDFGVSSSTQPKSARITSSSTVIPITILFFIKLHS